MKLGSFNTLDKQEAADADLVLAAAVPFLAFLPTFSPPVYPVRQGALFGSDAET